MTATAKAKGVCPTFAASLFLQLRREERIAVG